MNKEKSKCCNEDRVAVGTSEGTGYYICCKCKNEFIPQDNYASLDERLDKLYPFLGSAHKCMCEPTESHDIKIKEFIHTALKEQAEQILKEMPKDLIEMEELPAITRAMIRGKNDCLSECKEMVRKFL